MAHTSALEAEAGWSPGVSSQPGIHSEFQAILGCYPRKRLFQKYVNKWKSNKFLTRSSIWGILFLFCLPFYVYVTQACLEDSQIRGSLIGKDSSRLTKGGGIVPEEDFKRWLSHSFPKLCCSLTPMWPLSSCLALSVDFVRLHQQNPQIWRCSNTRSLRLLILWQESVRWSPV